MSLRPNRLNAAKIVFDIGKNNHDQPVRIELLEDGTFSLIREAANQRDEPAHITGLSREQVAKIGHASHVELGGL